MPGPPPPPMAPAAPPPPLFTPLKNSGGPNERNALLSSIRKGAKLKKTVTVDKSAPILTGKVSSNVSSVGSIKSNNVSSGNGFTGPQNGLGGLFAGGMPKLKPTGKLGTNNSSVNNRNNGNISNEDNVTPSKNFNSIQLQLKEKLASDSRNRGPPPPAPNKNMSGDLNSPWQHSSPREKKANGHHLNQLTLNNSALHQNSSTLHRKAKSNANLSTLDSPDSVNNNGFQQTKPVINHGKPNLAPRPPSINAGKPLTSLKKFNKQVSRTQSMKSPRSPSPKSPEDSVVNKFGTVRHLSSIMGQMEMHSPKTRPNLNTRPSVPPPSIPFQPQRISSPSQNHAPPPPPSKVNHVRHPNHAPPPPPAPLSQAPSHPPPPPPPHKTQPSRPPPLVPPSNGNPPPPPPPRHSSMRDNPPTPSRVFVDLDEKFRNEFHSVDRFPQPPPFRNFTKMYPNEHDSYVKTKTMVV